MSSSQLMIVLPQQKSAILLFQQQDTIVQDSYLFAIGTINGQIYRLRVYQDNKYNVSLNIKIQQMYKDKQNLNIKQSNNDKNNNINNAPVYSTCVWYQQYPDQQLSIYGRLTSSIAKDISNYILIIGCNNGNIYKLCSKSKTIQKTYYKQSNPCPLLNIFYSCNSALIYAINLNSQIVIINQSGMSMINRINFSCDICSITSINVHHNNVNINMNNSFYNLNHSLSASRINQSSYGIWNNYYDHRKAVAVAFNNKLPPFLIDYQNIQELCNDSQSNCITIDQKYMHNRQDIAYNILENYMKMQFIYKMEQQSLEQCEQIYLMSKGHKSNQLITANIISSHQQNYYICVYRLQTPNFLTHIPPSYSSYSSQQKQKIKNIPLCYFLHIKIQIPLRPISLTQYNNFIFCSLWQKMQILDLNKRKFCCKIKNDRQRWGFLLYVKDTIFTGNNFINGKNRGKDKYQQQGNISKNNQELKDEAFKENQSQGTVCGERKFWVMSAKGYNMWDIEKSRKGTVSLHFTKMTADLKFQ